MFPYLQTAKEIAICKAKILSFNSQKMFKGATQTAS